MTRSYKGVRTSCGGLIRWKGSGLAQSFFQQAIQKDPNLALAYVGLADSYVYMGSQRWVAPEEAYAKAREALQKALDSIRLSVKPTAPWDG